jgi:hypothetical protein
MRCCLCHRKLGHISTVWRYCHCCNIQICFKKTQIEVYDILENGELFKNRRKSILFESSYLKESI